jgi:EAL domain-containing protein (putative c-di-GMP-specific phosphodiesterase class I)/CHASE2 domain-containing sensor protein
VTARLLRIAAGERVFALLLGGALGLALILGGIGAGLEKAGADLRSGYAVHRASGAVAVVEIDGKSIAAFRRWPWPRTIHAQLVDRLRAAGAKQIAFDVDFSSPSDAAGDAAFAAALERAGGAVLLPTFRQEAAFGGGETIQSAPIPALAANAFLAAANVRPDGDGQLRRMPFAVDILGAPRPSLAALLADGRGEAGRSFAIDLRLDPGSVPRFSAVDVAEGRIPPEALRGKRVIVGGTAVALGDRYLVPGQGILPGVLVQAMAAETLLAGRGYGEGSAWGPLLLALLALGCGLTVRNRVGRVLLLSGTAAALLFLPTATERFFDTSLPIVPALTALFVGCAAAAARALAKRFRERGLTDGETGLPNLGALVAAAAPQALVSVGVVRVDRAAERLSAGGAAEMKGLLVRLAERLRFAAGTDVYRIDAGALAWLAPHSADDEDPLAAIAHLLRAATRESNHDLQLHFGAASGAGRSADALAASALLAASQAAAKGVASHVFSAADGALVRREEALLARFDEALTEGHIHAAYQPKRALATGRTAGVEALARWDDPALGAIPPDLFIPLLERHGRIADLTARILADSLEAVRGWRLVAPHFSVAVNVSAGLLHDAAAMLRLRQIFLASGVPASALVIEVTETAAMSDTDRAVASLQAWRELGAAVSIDDYGTGHSSLAYLQSLPATEIKIDGSFVHGLACDPRSAIMVKSTIALAHELGLAVVAEGVEDEAVLARLRAMGCDTAQGYAICRPAPPADITALLAAEAAGAASARRALSGGAG